MNEEEAAIMISQPLKYQDIFSKGSHNIGCFKEINHTIDTGTESPVIHPMCHTPMGFEGEEEENLKQMLEIRVVFLRLGLCTSSCEEERWLCPILCGLLLLECQTSQRLISITIHITVFGSAFW